MHDKPAQTRQPISDNIASRWSGRAFDPARPVSTADLEAVLEAARWAPSCFGAEPWRFVITRRDDSGWDALVACLSEGNQVWANDAACLMVVCTDTRFEHNDKPNRWAGYDAGAAAVSLCIEAAARDLMTHQMGGFSSDDVRALLSIPERYELMSVLALGYQLEQIPDHLAERETAARKRQALADRFFSQSWGQSLDV